MRLTVMTDSALRLLMHVAQHPQRLCTIEEIAGAQGIPSAQLMKITHRLALAGWLETVRGRGGGMRLARPAADIRLGEVVRSVEPDFALVDCFAGVATCRLTGRCALAGVLHGALLEFMRHLDAHTLADVLPKAGGATGEATAMLRFVPGASVRAGSGPRA